MDQDTVRINMLFKEDDGAALFEYLKKSAPRALGRRVRRLMELGFLMDQSVVSTKSTVLPVASKSSGKNQALVAEPSSVAIKSKIDDVKVEATPDDTSSITDQKLVAESAGSIAAVGFNL